MIIIFKVKHIWLGKYKLTYIMLTLRLGRYLEGVEVYDCTLYF